MCGWSGLSWTGGIGKGWIGMGDLCWEPLWGRHLDMGVKPFDSSVTVFLSRSQERRT